MRPIELRPLSFSEILDTAIGLYRRTFKTAATVAAVFTVPMGALYVMLLGRSFQFLVLADVESMSEEQMAAEFAGMMAGIVSASLLMTAIASVITGATTRIFADAYSGRATGVKPALMMGLRKAIPIIALSLVTAIPIFLGTLLCVIPGLLLMAIWYVAQPVLIIEDRGVFGSMKRSSSLVSGMVWRTLGLALVASLITSVVQSTLTTPFQVAAMIAMYLVPNFAGMATAVWGIATGIVAAIIIPFTAAFTVAVYFDLRVRKEGLDVAQMIEQLPPLDAPAADQGTQGDPFGLD